MDFAERIKHKRQELMLTQNDLAAKSGVSYGGIQAYERGQIPKGDNLLKISRILECSMDWLMTGKSFAGQFREVQSNTEVRQRDIVIEFTKGKQISVPLPDLDSETVVFLSKIEGRLSPGTNSLVAGDQVIGSYFFRKDWLKTVGNAQDLVLLDVVGDSMKPTLEEGDTVMIDTSRKVISDGNIYAVGEGEAILIKRIQSLVGGKVQIISDNRAMYQPQELDPAKNPIHIIGQIVWMAKKIV